MKNEPLKTELSNLELLPSHLFAMNHRQDRGGNGLVKAHTPVPEHLGGTEWVWLTWEDHQRQGLLQSEDFQCCCFWAGDVRKWLDTWPENAMEFEELYRKWHLDLSRRGHKTSKEKGVGIWSFETRQKGGLASGSLLATARKQHAWKQKVKNGYESPNRQTVRDDLAEMNRKRMKCPHCGHITSPGHINRHIKAKHSP